jgi:hypothetical protein
LEEGIVGEQGRRHKSDNAVEEKLVSDSASTLALACHNKELLRRCGAPRSAGRIQIESLCEKGFYLNDSANTIQLVLNNRSF